MSEATARISTDESPSSDGRVRKSARGERTLRAIVDAAMAIVSESGIASLSQESAARRARISQSTLRHYFPMKDDLVDAVFAGSVRRFQVAVEAILLDPSAAPRDKVLRIVDRHLDNIMKSCDSYNFDAFAYLSRRERERAKQDEWYRWLCEHYVALLRQINPRLDLKTSKSRALQLLTLSLGAWFTLGRSRGDWLGRSRSHVKRELMTAAAALVEAPPPRLTPEGTNDGPQG